MRSKLIIMVIVIALLLSNLNTSIAAITTTTPNIIEIYVNNELITKYLDDQRPFYDSANRTQVPLRTLLDSMGYPLTIKDNAIIIKADNGDVVVSFGSKTIKTPTATITMDTTVQVIRGRTFVPIRFIAEALGWAVGTRQEKTTVNGATKIINIVTVDKGNGTSSEQNETDIMSEPNGIKGVLIDQPLQENTAFVNHINSRTDGIISYNSNYKIQFDLYNGNTVKVLHQEIDNTGKCNEIQWSIWDTAVQEITYNFIYTSAEEYNEIYNALKYYAEEVHKIASNEQLTFEQRNIEWAKLDKYRNQWIKVGTKSYYHIKDDGGYHRFYYR